MNISFALEDTVIPADNTRMGSQLSGGKLVSYKYTNNYNSDFKDVGMDELYSEGRFYNCLFSGQHVDLTSQETEYLVFILNPGMYCTGNFPQFQEFCATFNEFEKMGNIYSNRNMQLLLYNVAQLMKCDYVLNDYTNFDTLSEPEDVQMPSSI